VAGEVIIDDRLFPPFGFRDQFKVRPIFVNDDLVDISIVPARKPGSHLEVTWRPKSWALTIDNRLTAGAPDSPNTLAVDPILPACIGTPRCSSTIKGNLPSTFVPPLTGKPVLVQAVRIVQPSNYARTVLVESLAAAGVTVDAPAVKVNPVRLLPAKGSYRPDTKVAQLTELSYGQDAKLILKISYNIGADTSLVLNGLAHGVNTVPSALQVERRILASHYGIASSQYHFIDGSGGGDTSATNGAVTHMLDELATAREQKAFVDALPILGVDGSLAFVKGFQRTRRSRGRQARSVPRRGPLSPVQNRE
jgi:D-alanyl-D-alanine carboxypeptidase